MNDAGLSAEQVTAISLSSDLEDIFIDCRIDGNIHNSATAPNSLIAALTAAQELLAEESTPAVLIVESQPQKQTIAAMVLAAHPSMPRTRKAVYAVIDNSSAAMSSHSYRDALDRAGISPEKVGLIVVPTLNASGISPAETQALLSAYPAGGEPICALSGSADGLWD